MTGGDHDDDGALFAPRHRGVRQADVTVLTVVAWHRELSPDTPVSKCLVGCAADCRKIGSFLSLQGKPDMTRWESTGRGRHIV